MNEKIKSTLIVPAAGRSSRFPNMKPKWMLTHPDGKLMIQKVLEELKYDQFSRVVISILQEHCDNHEGDLILRQVFGESVKIVVLPEPTNSVVDTVSQTIERASINGRIVIKDADCIVSYPVPYDKNYIVGLTVDSSVNVREVQNKSFIIKNDDGAITDIVEKKIVSDKICLGVYAMDVEEFLNSKKAIADSPVYRNKGEIYISHIVSYLLMKNKVIFEYVESDKYVDWGTLKEWGEEQKRCSTYVFDIDGVVLENRGKYGSKNWSNTFVPIEGNVEVLKELSDEGHEIIFMTSRTDEYLDDFKDFLNKRGIRWKTIVSGCNHSKRIIVNDFAPTNPYPSCESINIGRNDSLRRYIR